MFIIASICCMIMVGCGHKTKPRYVPVNKNKVDFKNNEI